MKTKRRTQVEGELPIRDPDPVGETDLVYKEDKPGSHVPYDEGPCPNFPDLARHEEGLRRHPGLPRDRFRPRSQWRTLNGTATISIKPG